MAQPLIVGDIIQFRTWSTDTDQASVQRMNYLVVSVTGSITDQDCCTLFSTAMEGPMKAILNNNATFNGIEAQLVSRTPLTASVFETADAGPGTAGAAALPRQTAGILTWLTPFAGVRFRGRLYMPFPAAADDQGNGIPTNAYEVKMFNVAQIYVGFTNPTVGINNAVLAQILVHKAGKTPTPLPTVITSYFIKQKWATQRRRGSFGRVNSSPI
jgi:hypothetical protein